MGMYTEIYTKITFKEDTPKEVIDIIKYMVGMIDETELNGAPDHPLFKTGRWDFMFQCCSYYHMPETNVKFWFDDIANQWFLNGRSDLKDYDQEIAKFFDWVKPYCETRGDEKTFIGYHLYEEEDTPTLVFIGN